MTAHEPNRAPTSVWPIRRLGDGRGWNLMVRTGEGDRIEVLVDPAIFDARPLTNVVSMSRGEARLLARRLNECLDATAKR